MDKLFLKKEERSSASDLVVLLSPIKHERNNLGLEIFE